MIPYVLIFIGEGVLFRATIEFAQQRGHLIAGILDTSREVDITTDDFVAARPCDILFSVINLHVLTETTLARPRLAAVNYHNAPLPAYAGLRATAWAVHDGAAAHGITWHRIDAGIDTGPILLQRRFALARDETTASLDARCTAEALASLDDLFARLERGDFAGEPQAAAGPTRRRRSDTVPDAGLLDWRWPAHRVARVVRACEWSSAANDFGTAHLLTLAGPIGVVAAAAAAGRGDPGTVLGLDGDTLIVACGDGAVRLMLDGPINIALGCSLPVPIPHPDASAYRASLLGERAWLPALRRLVSVPAPASVMVTGSVPVAGDIAAFLRAVYAVLGREAVVAVETPAMLLLHQWCPAMRGDLPDGPPPPRDIHRRYPALHGLADWPARAAALVPRDVPATIPAGTVAFAAGRVHFTDASAALAATLAAAMARTPLPLPSAEPVPRRIAAQARAEPGAAAVIDHGHATSRAGLAAAAEAWARRLIAAGARAEDGVAIALPPSAASVAAALGAVRAGCAYVPVDLAAPPARWRTEFTVAGVTHVCTDTDTAPRLAGLGPIIITDAAPATGELPERALDSLCAYRIFTSGSSGTPKAVEVTHAALANLAAGMTEAAGFTPADRMTMLAAPTFDASVADMWPALAAGAAILVPPAGIVQDPLALRDWLGSSAATVSFVPTAIAERLIGLPWPDDVALRLLITGGDALHRRPPPGLPFKFVNSYGPTENCVDTSWSEVTATGCGPPPIGRPTHGVTMTVLDAAGRPVEPGAAGELVIGGASVARGYRGLPRFTDERFEPDPDYPGHRRYRSGDLAMLDALGEYVFLGRIDNQIQVRGIRVEPGEVEALLKADPRVADAVCVPDYTGLTVTGLVAHVVPATTATESLAAALIADLASRLPSALVPRQIVWRSALPVTASGKIDRAALVSITAAVAGSVTGDPLRSLWARLRAGDVASEDASFWDLGGDSLAAIDLLLDVERLLGVRISVGTFLAEPTLAGLRRATAAPSRDLVVALRAGDHPAIVCCHGYSGDLEAYQQLALVPDAAMLLGAGAASLQDASVLPATMEAAAAAALVALAAAGSPYPKALLGYSWGGLLAFEMARQLGETGCPPTFVGLIGSFPPASDGWSIDDIPPLLHRTPRAAWRILTGRQPVPRAFDRLIRSPTSAGHAIAAAPVVACAQHYLGLARAYRPIPIAVPGVHLIRETAGREHIDLSGRIRHHLPDLGWSRWALANVAVHWVETDHLGLMRAPAVSHVSRIVQAAVFGN